MRIPFALRRMLERCSRRVHFYRRLPRRFGSLPLRVSPAASLVYYRGLRQPNFQDLYDFAEHHVNPSDTVWDVGANLGVFALAAAYRSGPGGAVVCLEPDSWSFALLQRSIGRNRGRTAPVTVLPAAAAGRLGVAQLRVPERSHAASHLAEAGGAGEDIVGGIREQHAVLTITLDWLAGHFPPPRVLKIDVDGAEELVLQGAKELLRRHQPRILIEVFERQADAVSAELRDLGYLLYDYTRGEAGKVPVSRATYNTLALPRSK
jgi:FkbM family methyltransferase